MTGDMKFIGSALGTETAVLQEELIFFFLEVVLLCLGVTLILFSAPKSIRKTGRRFVLSGAFAAAYGGCALFSGGLWDAAGIYGEWIRSAESLLYYFLLLPLYLMAVDGCQEKFVKKIARVYAWILAADFLLQSLLCFLPDEWAFAGRAADYIVMVFLACLMARIFAGDVGKTGLLRACLKNGPVWGGYLCRLYAGMEVHWTWVNAAVLLAAVFYTLFQLFHIAVKYLEGYEKNQEIKEFEKMAYTDVMTGLGNRAAMEREMKFLQENVKLCKNIWCVAADINGLKRVNNNFGHLAGDRMICTVAECFRAAGKGKGKIFRSGGDEFVVFFTDCKEKEVRDFIERFRDSLLKHQDKEWKELQVAVGYEAAGEGEDAINDLINRADLKMYENKRKQREI